MKAILTIDLLQGEATIFSDIESAHKEPSLYGVTDGKVIGTYLEHKFQACLRATYQYIEGNSAKGIDFPELMVDIKVTSERQPQSSCPFQISTAKDFWSGVVK